ncbi:MAG: hypothetical protein J0M12_01500 [Deltaproteobacteria bacterium]|nr:hypothetical protein [Deltaproteobacteria bacterium]
MYTVPSVLRAQSVQGVTNAAQDADSSIDPAVKAKFDTFMKGVLTPDKENNVNEEELFAGLIQERIYSLKGQEVGDQFKAVFDKNKAQCMGQNGYCFTEKAARDSLVEFQSSGKLTLDEANKIHSEAFEAAQLDDNKTALFDGHGGPNDPTMAVAQMEAALLAAQTMLQKISSGAVAAPNHAITAEYPALGTIALRTDITQLGGTGGDPKIGSKVKSEITPRRYKIDGNEGMLWKPFAEHTGKLIMMLPPTYTGQVQSITLRNSETGHKLDAGRYFSVGAGPTGREKWIFKKPGDKYPDDVTVQIKFRDGNMQTMHIAKPGKRYD